MNGFQNPYINPYGFVQPQQFQQPVMQQPQKQVEKLKGRNAALQYPLGPNSSAWILDESGLISWLITTDSAGYKTVSPYDVSPHQDAPAPDFGNLEDRIKRLEETVNGITRNSSAVSTKQSDVVIHKTDDGHDKRFTEPTTYDESIPVKQPTVETGNGYGKPTWGRSQDGIL